MTVRRGPTVVAGESVPEFTAPGHGGPALTRGELLGSPAVLFFYPRAGSLGCTLEAREFARLLPAFAGAGARVVGISVDPPEAEGRFRAACHLPFDLLADSDGSLSRQFGVLGRWGMARRVTFVVDRRGTVIRVIRSVRPGRHARLALSAVLGLQPPDAIGPREC